ncbi:MAG: cupin domain-containing protein [Gemmatimonadaceae bacterium]
MTRRPSRRFIATAITVAALAACAASGTRPSRVTPTPDRAIFSPLRPMGSADETVYGDPEVPGALFVLRIRELAGTIVPPHRHPGGEHITVLEGTWYFGLGDRFDSAAVHELRAGSYAYVPAGAPMFAYSPGPVTVQIHGIGPFHQAFVDPLLVLYDSARVGGATGVASGPGSPFQFQRGEQVVAPLGAGRIRQGYAAGSVIEYEIQADDGRLFMAQQGQMHRLKGP